MSICFGCENKQKKDNYVSETNMQTADSMSCRVDKSNLKREEILSWDYDQVIGKLGKPILRDTFSMLEITEFCIELLNYLPEDSSILINELTFEINADTNLTIWYYKKNEKWQPIHFGKWYKNTQF